MSKRYNNGLSLFLSLMVIGFLSIPFISSCGKSGVVNPASSNIRYEVINLSPDLGPVSLYIDYHVYNNSSYYYPTNQGYFYLTNLNLPFQIRSAPGSIPGEVSSTVNIFSMNDTLKPNLNYTLFIAGIKRDSSIVRVFLADTSSLPGTGRGKVRFINLSPLSPNFDVVANGTPAFTNQQYLKVSPFIEMPAGNYNFEIFPAGASAPTIGTIKNFTVQDGKLYTLYTYGLAGRTDSLAFGTGNILNNPQATNH